MAPPVFTDAAGTEHAAARGAVRIVSLVPSITELVCDLGLADALVGRTGFCIHPREVLRRIPKVGGTKDVDLDKVRAVAPTHAIVNVDENRRETAAALAQFVPHVIVTHPLAPHDNLALYRLIGGVFGRRREAEALARRFEAAYARALRAGKSFARERVLYLIWRDPWMTVARETYISRALALVGWDTWPEVSHERYPEIALDSAMLSQVGVILLSSEPYRFRARDVSELVRGPELADKRVALIDGEMTSWYGSRAVLGLRYLPPFRRTLDRASGTESR
jgi:ABC-type Fe3+-hydroxamate transport system substrate-binding protein